MFAKVTRHLISETDPDGSLIAVSRLTDSDKLQPLDVVLKSPKKWPWQRPKYRPTDFTLAQITLGKKTLQPVVAKSDFLNYEGTYAGAVGGALSAEVGGVRVKAEGRGSSKLQSSLGRLHKEVVDINRLMKDSKDRLMDLQHPLVQQSLCKRKVITVLKQRILTSKSCSLRYHGLGTGSCGAILSLLKTFPLKLSVNEDSSLQMDSDVSMEIPANTVLAYSVIELRIKSNRQYEFCFQADVSGGFDWGVGRTNAEDSGVCEIDGPLDKTKPMGIAGEILSTNNSVVELADLKGDLGVLSKLDVASRSSVLSVLGPSLLDRDFFISLEDWLDDWCSDEVASVCDWHDQRVQAIVSLLQSLPHNQDTALQKPWSVNGKHVLVPKEEAGSSSSSANQTSASSDVQVDGRLVGRALHLLVSALLELTSDCLDLIQSCYSDGLLPPLSQIMEPLVQSQAVPLDAVPPLLHAEEALHRVESLFRSAGLQLVTQADKLLVESKETAGFQSVTMWVVIQGLAALMSV
ncbi:hypothetical protein ACEWY4_024230 [Coilia grayii]|uniref:Gasdermin pore forming domain-containing protein n=1 Tax=Coilia grayii TaxID=363190 RepID=A0ABD1IZR7_9TELE